MSTRYKITRVELAQVIIEDKSRLEIYGVISEEHKDASTKNPAYNKITVILDGKEYEITGCFACEAMFFKEVEK